MSLSRRVAVILLPVLISLAATVRAATQTPILIQPNFYETQRLMTVHGFEQWLQSRWMSRGVA
jgi:hypothetical protein